jgi:cell division protease FtsH
MSDADRRRTAYHEAGHALVGMLTPDADPVRKVSIIPRGTALGVTFSTPDADRFTYTIEDLAAKIRVMLGGRAAEEIVLGNVTTGAESDIEMLTQLARHMVGRWGMSPKVGLVAVLPRDNAGPFDADGFAQRTREILDDEVRRMIDDAYEEVVALLRDERERLDALAEALLAEETLDEDEAYAAAGIRRPSEPIVV